MLENDNAMSVDGDYSFYSGDMEELGDKSQEDGRNYFKVQSLKVVNANTSFHLGENQDVEILNRIFMSDRDSDSQSGNEEENLQVIIEESKDGTQKQGGGITDDEERREVGLKLLSNESECSKSKERP